MTIRKKNILKLTKTHDHNNTQRKMHDPKCFPWLKKKKDRKKNWKQKQTKNLIKETWK